jgi:hypothetical protein
MMAQLDMPAMVLTVLALFLFIKKRYEWSAIACVALVLVKETGIVAPFLFFVVLLAQRDWKRASYFIPSAVALAWWLVVLHSATGYWLGNPGFAHYNIGYSLHPVRIALSLIRHVYYIFVAEFRWIGTLAIVFAAWKRRAFSSTAWILTTALSVATLVLVSVLGGAELERYLLPVLPVFYIATAVALTYIPKLWSAIAGGTLLAGLIANLFWNPPYPFPYENNLAMVDFVRLQQIAAEFTERKYPNRNIATAWPYTAALRDPDFGFVTRGLRVVETNDFHAGSINRLAPGSFDVLITYTRTWAPANGVIANAFVRRFLTHFYEWQPDITAPECARLGLFEVADWSLRGQEITIYSRGLHAERQLADSLWPEFAKRYM